jgi:hypothetical protein
MFRMAHKIYGFVPCSSSRPSGKRTPLNQMTMNATLYNEVAEQFKQKWSPWTGWAQAILFASNYLKDDAGTDELPEESSMKVE